MGQYTKKGLLNGYKKNNTERAELDYYATPAVEVENILEPLEEEMKMQLLLLWVAILNLIVISALK